MDINENRQQQSCLRARATPDSPGRLACGTAGILQYFLPAYSTTKTQRTFLFEIILKKLKHTFSLRAENESD